jgi:hypothetical protein
VKTPVPAHWPSHKSKQVSGNPEYQIPSDSSYRILNRVIENFRLCGQDSGNVFAEDILMKKHEYRWIAFVCVATLAAELKADEYRWKADVDTNWNTVVGTNTNWANFDSEFFGAPDTLPGADDKAFHDNRDFSQNVVNLPAIGINSNATADALLLSFGGSVNHTAGTLTIATGSGPDTGLWIGELADRSFGPTSTAQSVYTLNGGTVTINDTADGFQIGRAWAQNVPDNAADSLYSDGRLNFQSGTLNVLSSESNIGLDGYAVFDQSGGVFNAAAVHLGRFASPNTTTTLSNNAKWNLSGPLLLSDGQTIGEFLTRAEGPGVSQLNIVGSQVDVNTAGLHLRGQSTLNFVADASGVSPIALSTGGFELLDINLPNNSPNYRPQLNVNLANFANTTSDITLIDGHKRAVGEFRGLPEGSTSPSFGGRTLTYRGGADHFDIALVVNYVPPLPDPEPNNAVIARWSMNLDGQNNVAPFPHGNPKVFDSRTGADQGIEVGDSGLPAGAEHLWFFSANTTPVHNFTTSSDVPPTAMFINGNNSGASSYDASAVTPASQEGALFYPQNQYGNEFAFDNSFSLELFMKPDAIASAAAAPVQQLLLQGEGFARYGITMNEEAGGIRFFVNDGEEHLEFVDIGGAVGIGDANYNDGEWHYVLATFEDGAGANGTGQLRIAVANQDGATAINTLDLSAAFLGLPQDSNDGNMLIGTENFALPGGDDGPRRFNGLIDEIQISRGLVSNTERLGFLDIQVVLGDYNGDHVVNAADYTVWRDNLGKNVSLAGENPASTTPGLVDAEDYAFWKSHFGNTSGAGAGGIISGTVPEPASLLLFLVAVLGISGRSHRWLSL